MKNRILRCIIKSQDDKKESEPYYLILSADASLWAYEKDYINSIAEMANLYGVHDIADVIKARKYKKSDNGFLYDLQEYISSEYKSSISDPTRNKGIKLLIRHMASTCYFDFLCHKYPKLFKQVSVSPYELIGDPFLSEILTDK